ncbi:Cu(I)-responsive transcriptional regulator [Neisseria weaveri]|uniref:MerR family transcriptional regulator n=1 Tax=Neisseria weaveri TaxID=28091 RepID=A0A448VQX6_9NEIS|nr:Cu(I)-responsive transcriptional regulator [Neisseria weaveri]EGV37998.1 CspA family cold shock transcriptional regulator [Neisseria weaveri LMG 5135]VEJ52167.1 MerR family transcriptional regulator [Neisseria weaveri]
MNISEAARQTGLSAKQIRDYEKHGLLAPTPRTESGYRRYEENDLKRLKFIRHAREVGFSLQQTAELLKLQDNPVRNSREVKALTARHIAALNAQILSLQQMVAELQSLHDACKGDDCPECSILEGLGK